MAQHVFSCDSKKASQKFIKKFHPEVKTLFEDVKSLGEARAWDIISRSSVSVPSAMILVAGFVCTDVSHLNNGSKDLRAGMHPPAIAFKHQHQGCTSALSPFGSWSRSSLPIGLSSPVQDFRTTTLFAFIALSPILSLCLSITSISFFVPQGVNRSSRVIMATIQ